MYISHKCMAEAVAAQVQTSLTNEMFYYVLLTFSVFNIILKAIFLVSKNIKHSALAGIMMIIKGFDFVPFLGILRSFFKYLRECMSYKWVCI